jgi:hypothetical protein
MYQNPIVINANRNKKLEQLTINLLQAGKGGLQPLINFLKV